MQGKPSHCNKSEKPRAHAKFNQRNDFKRARQYTHDLKIGHAKSTTQGNILHGKIMP